MESVDAILNTGFIWDDILKMGEKLSRYLYLPEVKFNEEDFVHIENLEGDWYYAIYNYQPIKRKHTE